MTFGALDIVVILQFCVAFAILNVWLFRSEKPSRFRGANAKTLREEFVKYGLSDNFYLVIKYIKPLLAITLLAGTFVPYCTQIGAIGLGILMLGSVWMHFRVRDKFVKYIPALVLLSMCIIISLYS